MPQMAPYNWLILYFMFSFLLIYLISMIYFIYTPFPLTKISKMKKLYNWKW